MISATSYVLPQANVQFKGICVRIIIGKLFDSWSRGTNSQCFNKNNSFKWCVPEMYVWCWGMTQAVSHLGLEALESPSGIHPSIHLQVNPLQPNSPCSAILVLYIPCCTFKSYPCSTSFLLFIILHLYSAPLTSRARLTIPSQKAERHNEL